MASRIKSSAPPVRELKGTARHGSKTLTSHGLSGISLLGAGCGLMMQQQQQPTASKNLNLELPIPRQARRTQLGGSMPQRLLASPQCPGRESERFQLEDNKTAGTCRQSFIQCAQKLHRAHPGAQGQVNQVLLHISGSAGLRVCRCKSSGRSSGRLGE